MVGNPEFYAHTKAGADGELLDASEWEPLFTEHCPALSGDYTAVCEKCERLDERHGHLNKVAYHTARNAAAMFPADSDEAKAAHHWGYLTGLWHDLGKFFAEFQARLQGEPVQCEHSGAGALAAKSLSSKHAILAIASAIAGHHCGLANSKEARKTDGRKLTPLLKRWQNARIPADIPPALATALSDAVAYHSKTSDFNLWKPAHGFCQSLASRMLFSCLIDADSAATEAFVTPDSDRFTRSSDSLHTLSTRLDTSIDRKCREAPSNALNDARREILTALRQKASDKPGWFSLNVPTGGGKTLASLSFALRHACENDHRRVIAGIPFTSIIDQSAKIYRSILGDENVLEHHSNLDDFDDDDEGISTETLQARMSCEDWDRPLIVTTNVQLLESLFAHKRARARKTHRVARSVIILDEMQSIPERVLAPVLSALDELVRSYGCSVVICTATQPAVERTATFPIGIEISNERSLAPEGLHQRSPFKRVAITWPSSPIKPTPYATLAKDIANSPSSLSITHLKKDARELFDSVVAEAGGEGAFHLSTFMCPAHRTLTLERIHDGLARNRRDGTPCRVVSTQLVEAGVDLDFPIVYRALAGIDSIVQAAGRCNREQSLPDGTLGRVIVFLAETEPPPGLLQKGLALTKKMLAANPELNIFDPAVIRAYFEELYHDSDLDDHHILDESDRHNLETVGQEMRLIEEAPKTSVVVTYDETARARLNAARDRRGTGGTLRSLQPYSLSVFNWVTENLRSKLEPLFPDSETLVLDTKIHSNLYSEQFGLALEAADTPIPPKNLQV